MLEKTIKYLTIALLASCTALAVTLTVYSLKLGHKLSVTMDNVHLITDQIQLASAKTVEYVDFQTNKLRDPYQQKLIDASLAVGGQVASVARSVNTLVLPSATRAMDSVTATSDQFRVLVANSDAKINQEVLPEAQKSIAGLGRVAETASDAVSKLQSSANGALRSTDKAIRDLNSRINDPAITTTLTELAATATEIRKSTENLEYATVSVKESFSYAPEIFRNGAKFSRNQAKWSWVVGGVRVVRAIAF